MKHTFLEFRHGLPLRKRSTSDTLLERPMVSDKDTDVISDVSTQRPGDAVSDGDDTDASMRSVAAAKPLDTTIDYVEKFDWADADDLDCGKTTVMFRNVPNDYTRSMFLALLDNEGFTHQYDFVYLPIDFSSKSGFGYAFINLISTPIAERFRTHFDGFSDWELPSYKLAEVTWSTPSQGLATHIERYRNSPVMHEGVPDEFRPVLYKDGVRVPFPLPTKLIKAPRVRHSAKRRDSGRRGDRS